MSKGNQFSGVYTPEQQRAVAEAINTIKENMPFLITLTKKEKKALKPMAARSQPMVEKAYSIGLSNPKLVPSFTDIDEMGRDLTFWKAMRPHALELIALASSMDDTMAAGGSGCQPRRARHLRTLAKGGRPQRPNRPSHVRGDESLFRKGYAKRRRAGKAGMN